MISKGDLVHQGQSQNGYGSPKKRQIELRSQLQGVVRSNRFWNYSKVSDKLLGPDHVDLSRRGGLLNRLVRFKLLKYGAHIEGICVFNRRMVLIIL